MYHDWLFGLMFKFIVAANLINKIIEAGKKQQLADRIAIL
jgi:hypothetical protein